MDFTYKKSVGNTFLHYLRKNPYVTQFYTSVDKIRM